MVTIRDVAERSHVSIATVSNVINGNGKVSQETRQRVLNVIEELNYIPNRLAKNLKTRSVHTIGVITEELTTLLTSAMLNGISSYCNQHSWSMQLCNLQLESCLTPTLDYCAFQQTPRFQNALNAALHTLLSSQMAGIIYIGAHPRDVSRLLPRMDIPLIYLFSYTDGETPYINTDFFQGAALATEHLIQKGHRRIALVCGPVNSIPAHQRLSGYQETLMKYGLTFYPEYILSGDWSIDSGYAAGRKILSMERLPTAALCMNDNMALGIIRYLRQQGRRVPEDLSIIGFDSTVLVDCIDPPLTSVHIPFFEMGRRAMEGILTQLSVKEPPGPGEAACLLPCTLDVRKSVASIPRERETDRAELQT